MNTETAIRKITGDREIQREFLEMSHLYDAAIREVRTKLEILDREFSILYASNPIHHIDSRLKSRAASSKAGAQGLPVTIESAEANLQDIAGVRIVCNYIDDIYRLADLLVRQQDLELVARKDYIREPKPNGYRSLHLVPPRAGVPVQPHGTRARGGADSDDRHGFLGEPRARAALQERRRGDRRAEEPPEAVRGAERRAGRRNAEHLSGNARAAVRRTDEYEVDEPWPDDGAPEE